MPESTGKWADYEIGPGEIHKISPELIHKLLSSKVFRGKRVLIFKKLDLFREDVPDELIDRMFAVFALRTDVTWMVLTKRPERMCEYASSKLEKRLPLHLAHLRPLGFRTGNLDACAYSSVISLPLPNVWLGTPVEDQPQADDLIPWILKCPAAVRFLVCEPLLGPVVLDHRWLPSHTDPPIFSKRQSGFHDKPNGGVHWVIVGGESGPKARPCDIEWVRSIVDQCASAGVPCFVKQLGAKPTYAGGLWHCCSSSGSDPNEWPEDLRVREFPQPKE